MRFRSVVGAATVALALASGCRSNSSGARVLSDCAYSDKVATIIDTFQRNVGQAVADLTSDTAASAETEDAKAAITALDKELGKAITDLKALKVEGEILKVNEELVGGLQDFRDRLPDATRAAEAGQFQRIETVLDESGQSFANRFDGLAQRYPDGAARLAKCQ